MRERDITNEALSRLVAAEHIDISSSPLVDQRVALGIEAVAFALLAINDSIRAAAAHDTTTK